MQIAHTAQYKKNLKTQLKKKKLGKRSKEIFLQRRQMCMHA